MILKVSVIFVYVCFVLLTKRSVASGDKNGLATVWVLLGVISELLLQIKEIIQVLLMGK